MKRSPRYLLEGTLEDPLVVVRSATWGFNAIGVFHEDAAAVVDPGMSRQEVDMLKEGVTRCGTETPRQVTHVILTHAHHDHIRGWDQFPGAEVTFPRIAAEKDEGARTRIVAAKRKLDERIDGVDEAFCYPTATLTFEHRLRIEVGGMTLEQRFLPGHSNCTSVVWVPELKTLFSADYLVTPGMPYCRWQASKFEAALDTLRRWVGEDGIERIVPAHNRILEGPADILAAIDEESTYMQVLRQEVRQVQRLEHSEEQGIRKVARVMVERRGSDLGGRRQDQDNARRVWVEERA